MTYIVKDIPTPEGEVKKQFYNLVWMKDARDENVEVQVWNGEFNKDELEDIKANIQTQIDDIDVKLAYFTE